MPINWQDGSSGGTPLSAANLNRLAVVADISTTGTPTGDAVKAVAAAQVTDGAIASQVAAGTQTRAALKAAYARRWSRQSVPGEQGFPTPMTSPPTVGAPVDRGTVEAGVAAAIYDSTNTLILNPAFTFRGGPWEAVDAFPAVRFPTTKVLSGERPISPAVEFLYYGSSFTFGYKGQGWLAYRLWVDGKLVNGVDESDSLGQTGTVHARTVTFATVGWRHIRIDVGANGFWGIDKGATSDIVSPVAQATGRRLLVVHDSYGEGTGAQYGPWSGYAPNLAAMLGYDLVNLSQGGTGVLTDNAGAGRVRYRTRIPDWAPVQPTAVLLGVSINDDTQTASAIADELDYLIPQVQAIPTVADVWVLGAAPRGYTDVTTKQARDAVIGPRVQSHAGAQFVSLVSPSAVWTSATNSTLMWSDGAHPSQAGHEVIARVAFDRLLAQIAA